MCIHKSFEHLNKVSVRAARATMDSKLEERRSVIKLLLIEVEKTHYSKVAEKFFLKPAYPIQPFIAWFHSLGRAGQEWETSLG